MYYTALLSPVILIISMLTIIDLKLLNFLENDFKNLNRNRIKGSKQNNELLNIDYKIVFETVLSNMEIILIKKVFIYGFIDIDSILL